MVYRSIQYIMEIMAEIELFKEPFKSLSEFLIKKIAKSISIVKFTNNNIIYEEGELWLNNPSASAYVVIKGEIKLYK